LSLLLLTCSITFNDLHILNHPCIPGMKPTWSECMHFLIYCWIQLANIVLKILHQCSLKRLVSNSPFLFCPYSVLGWMSYWLHGMNLAVFLIFISLKSLRNVSITSFL
jgi:hypothetical protein